MDADQIKLVELSRGALGLAAFLLGDCMAVCRQSGATIFVCASAAADTDCGKGTMPAVGRVPSPVDWADMSAVRSVKVFEIRSGSKEAAAQQCW